LVKGHDPKVWADELIKLLTNSELLKKLSQGAVNKAKAFSWDKTVDQLLNTYQTALENQNSSKVRINAV